MFQNAVNYLLEFINRKGGLYNGWYSGVTNNPEQRIFQQHKVNRVYDPWAYYPCTNAPVARDVEQHLLNLGMQGDVGGGDNQSLVVYVYKITDHSQEKT